MIGLRAGLRIGLNVGLAVGLSADELGGSAFDMHIGMFGQSNPLGNTNSGRSGGSNLTGSDSGLQFNTGTGTIIPFPACTWNQDWQDALSNPLNFQHTGTEALQLFRPVGQLNCGPSQSMGRFLVKYGVAKAPFISNCAITSSSLPINWAPSSNYPGSGEKLYAHLRDFMKARAAEVGRPFDIWVHYIGETDAAVPAQTSSVVADYTAFYAQLRSDLGQPNLPVILVMPNDAWAAIGPADTAGYKANQVTWMGNDGKAVAVDPSMIPLDDSPHYRMGGYNDVGQLIALRIRDVLKPGLSLNLQSGPTPWIQGIGVLHTAQASPEDARPRGWTDPQAGDIELLVAHGSPTTATVSLTTAASFSLLIAQTDAINGAAHRSVMAWTRPVDATLLNARATGADGRKIGPCATPHIDFGVGTNNLAEIVCVRGSSGTGNTQTGTAASGLTLTIPTFNTTVDNALIVIAVHSNNVANTIASVTNSNLSNITVEKDSNTNCGTGTPINTAIISARKATAGAVGATTITLAGVSSVIVGCAVEFKP